MSLVTFSFQNWSKFNPRSDKSNYSWFRFENTFLHDQKIFSLTNDQKCLYILCLCEASRKNGDEVSIEIKYASSMLGLREKTTKEHFDYLFSVGLLSSERRQKDVNSTSKVPATRRDERDETRLREPPLPPELEKIVDGVLKYWCSEESGLPRPREITNGRKKKLVAIVNKNPQLDYWVKVIEKLDASDFCKGKNERGWKADFDWFVRPDTHLKLMEGKYDNRKAKEELRCDL